MLNNYIKILIIILLYSLTNIIFRTDSQNIEVTKVYSPAKISLNEKIFELKDIELFDDNYTVKNSSLSKELNINEDEAFIIGTLGKYWANNLLLRRSVTINQDDLIYEKRSYKEKLLNTGFCLKNNKPCSESMFNELLHNIRKSNYKAIDLDTNEILDINKESIEKTSRYVIMKSSHIRWARLYKSIIKIPDIQDSYSDNDIKLLLSDFTQNLKPRRECTTSICKEIVSSINNAERSIDIAIYGYSDIKNLRSALSKAVLRGVKIRLVYDADSKNRNIYPDTKLLLDILTDNSSDFGSYESNSLMHNKFYIFDDKKLITGSANLSHTDMSGFNSNSVIVIESEGVANIYKKEFEQMYFGKYHNDKTPIHDKSITHGNTSLKILFSPQDKSITNYIIPLINNAKNYIYIPTFVLTDIRVVNALTNAKKRGVDVKIIIDALNASIKHSKHKELRAAGIDVKTENYAGKMHSKSMLIDDKYTVIGSMNFSNSGENKNDENIVIIENVGMTKFYKQFFLYQWQKIDNKWLYKNARAESKDSIGSCSDGIDNNYNGLIDSEDFACN
ncbi:DUF1669 domain-containing protein [bacterium]|nr:DUF1669 domain-containing protein [bacterium]